MKVTDIVLVVILCGLTSIGSVVAVSLLRTCEALRRTVSTPLGQEGAELQRLVALGRSPPRRGPRGPNPPEGTSAGGVSPILYSRRIKTPPGAMTRRFSDDDPVIPTVPEV